MPLRYQKNATQWVIFSGIATPPVNARKLSHLFPSRWLAISALV